MSITAPLSRRSPYGPLVVLAMLLSLAFFYRASYQLPLSVLGLAAFAGLALLRPDLALLFVPLSAPLYLMPKGIWDERFGIRPDGLRVPLHEAALLIVVLATLPRLLLLAVRLVQEGRLQQVVRAWTSESRLALIVPAALFLLAGTASLALALPEGRGEALRQWRWTIAEPLLFFGLALFWTHKVAWGPQLVATLALSSGAVALIGLLQYAGIDLVPLIGQRMSHTDSVIVVDGVRRVSSVYGHPNNLALFLGRTWPLALALAVASFAVLRATRSPQPSAAGISPLARAWLVWAGCGLLALLALLVTYSRGANMAALAAGAVLAWGAVRAARGPQARWTVGLALALLAALLLTLLRNDGGEGGSVGARLLLWREALAMIRDHPLGIGPGQFYFYHNPEFGHGYIAPELVGSSEQFAAHPHNLLLDTYLQVGPLGLAALLWLLGIVLLRSLRAQQHASGSWQATLLLGLGAGLAAALVHGMADNFYFVPDLAIFFWTAVALIAWFDKHAADGYYCGSIKKAARKLRTTTMAKCVLTGRKVSFGHNVSHAKNRTNRAFKPNVHKHRVFVPELGTMVTLKLSAKGLRTITKKGLLVALRDEGLTLKDVL